MSSLFFSYSHKDEALRDRLEVHLAMLKRQGAISTWHDRIIKAGDNFGREIDANLERADVILLLISPDFIDSDYCHEVEMQRALARHAEGTARVIPVILKPCDWMHPPLSNLLAAPTDGKPIVKWPNEDDAFVDVIRMIREALPASGGAPAPAVRQSPRAAVPSATIGPRSSNLRLSKQFSDADRDRFLEEAFEAIGHYFENSLAELSARNDGIEGRFRRLDSTRFSAVIYQGGTTRAQSTIFLGSPFGRGIGYSNRADGAANSYNEMLTVENDDQHLFLRTMGMATMGRDRESQFNFEGAAEHLWSMLIAPLQRR